MTVRKAIIAILVAALAMSVAAPAMAKKQNAEQVTTTQPQAKKKAKQQSGENCFLKAPPYMYNPRFMNRGFFKKVCPGQDEQ